MRRTATENYPFLEQMPVGVLVLDRELNVTASNNRALELLDIPVESLLSESLPAIMEGSPLYPVLMENRAGGVCYQRSHFKMGGRDLQITLCFPEPDAPEDSNIVITVDDLTHYKQMEAVKAEFISILLHKIRNPLTSIKTSLAMLKGGMVSGLPQGAKEILEISHGEVDRLNRLLNDLRSLFAIETGLAAKEMELENVDVMKVIYRALEDVCASLPGADGVKERFDIEGDLASQFRGDFEKARQALYHLFRNAALYSDRKTKVRVRVQRDSDQITIAVQDKGIGVPEKALAHVFEKYYRADNAFSTDIEGNGLGLYIARAFIETMKGSLYCESRETNGTTFFIGLPRQQKGE